MFVLDAIDYITPEEACRECALHPNNLDSWYVKTKKGVMDMPFIDGEKLRRVQGYRYRLYGRPNYLLPKDDFIFWIVKQIPRF